MQYNLRINFIVLYFDTNYCICLITRGFCILVTNTWRRLKNCFFHSETDFQFSKLQNKHLITYVKVYTYNICNKKYHFTWLITIRKENNFVHMPHYQVTFSLKGTFIKRFLSVAPKCDISVLRYYHFSAF